MTKKLKLFLWIAIVAWTGGCAKFNAPKPDKEEREIAMRVIETYAHIIRAKDMENMIDDERLMYYTATRIIKDYLNKAAAKID